LPIEKNTAVEEAVLSADEEVLVAVEEGSEAGIAVWMVVNFFDSLAR